MKRVRKFRHRSYIIAAVGNHILAEKRFSSRRILRLDVISYAICALEYNTKFMFPLNGTQYLDSLAKKNVRNSNTLTQNFLKANDGRFLLYEEWTSNATNVRNNSYHTTQHMSHKSKKTAEAKRDAKTKETRKVHQCRQCNVPTQTYVCTYLYTRWAHARSLA